MVEIQIDINNSVKEDYEKQILEWIDDNFNLKDYILQNLAVESGYPLALKNTKIDVSKIDLKSDRVYISYNLSSSYEIEGRKYKNNYKNFVGIIIIKSNHKTQDDYQVKLGICGDSFDDYGIPEHSNLYMDKIAKRLNNHRCNPIENYFVDVILGFNNKIINILDSLADSNLNINVTKRDIPRWIKITNIIEKEA